MFPYLEEYHDNLEKRMELNRIRRTQHDARYQTTSETVPPLTRGAAVRENCAKNLGTDTVEDTGVETVTEQLTEEESQNDFKHHGQKDRNVMHVDGSSDVESSASFASEIDAELVHETTNTAKCQATVPTDITDPPAGPHSSPPLSQSYSMCDTVGESQLGQHEVPEDTATSAVTEMNTSGIQLPSVEDEHLPHLAAQQQEGQTNSLTEDSVCSEMSGENSLNVSEENEPNSELGSKSTTSRTPASHTLFSADEEDEVSSQAEQESTVENEAVSDLFMWSVKMSCCEH